MTFEKVRQLIVKQKDVYPDEVTLESSLLDDLGCDSLDLAYLTSAVEKEFNIDIPDAAVEKFKTVQDVVEYIKTAQ